MNFKERAVHWVKTGELLPQPKPEPQPRSKFREELEAKMSSATQNSKTYPWEPGTNFKQWTPGEA